MVSTIRSSTTKTASCTQVGFGCGLSGGSFIESGMAAAGRQGPNPAGRPRHGAAQGLAANAISAPHAAGDLFCLARSPIFGRPKLRPPSLSDFGKHVAALGQLLARANDRHYAQARLAQYRQIAERKSGRSHLKAK
jgi:hypothetical protein